MESNQIQRKTSTQTAYYLPHVKHKSKRVSSKKYKIAYFSKTNKLYNSYSHSHNFSCGQFNYNNQPPQQFLSQICDVYYFPKTENIYLFIPNSYYENKSPSFNHHTSFEIRKQVEIPYKYQMRILKYSSMPDCIKGPCKKANLAFKIKLENSNMIWHLYPYDRIRQVCQGLVQNQKFNHFPFTFQLGRKDNMYRHHMHFKAKFPSEYKFVPLTFILPFDEAEYRKKISNGKKCLWIVKPVNSSRGRGIHLLRNNNDFEHILKVSAGSSNMQYLLSKYITCPHLINSKKYDLRIYVLITSFSPLKIYLYKEGLVRFATENYQKNDTQNIFIHLTNYSINKLNTNYISNKDEGNEEDDKASKWSLEEYRNYYIQNKQEEQFNIIWEKIKDIVVKTVISVADEASGQIPYHKKDSCFEVYGFDILIDKKFRPWLLEVNVNASLNCTSPLDLKIKTNLISDTFNIVGIVPYHHNFPHLIYKLPSEESKGDEPLNLPCINPENTKALFTAKANILRDFNKKTLTVKREDYTTDYFLLMLEDMKEEFERSMITNYALLFPLKENIEYYSQFLMYNKNPNTENIVAWQWILTH